MNMRRITEMSPASISMAFVLMIAARTSGAPWDTVIFRDDFNGPEISGADWVINNPNSDWWQPLGRTFFPCPVHHTGDPFPRIENDSCVIEFHTYNHRHLHPPKTTFLSGEIHSTMEFDPDKPYRFEARVKSNAYPGGLVTSFFLYGYDGADADEIDFEFVSNKTNDNAAWPLGDPVLTNTWDETLESPQYATEGGMDLSQWNTFRIYWYPGAQRVEWTWMDPAAGETLLRTETDASRIPDEPMSLYFNFWAPGESWGDAYDAALQPAQIPADDEVYTYEIDYAEVRVTSLPGDTDADFDVDDADYENFIAQFGDEAPVGNPSADFNGDGMVDLEDFAVLRANFDPGAAFPSGRDALTAPEPGSLLLLLAISRTALNRKRRRR